MTWKTSEEQGKARFRARVDTFIESESDRIPEGYQLAPIVAEVLRLLYERCKERGLDSYYGPAAAALCAAEANCAMLEAEKMVRAKRKGHTGDEMMESVVEIAEACTAGLKEMVKHQYAGSREQMVEKILEGKEGEARDV